jgi:hypothetical protein
VGEGLMGMGLLQRVLLVTVLVLRKLRRVPLLIQNAFPRWVLFLAATMWQRGVESWHPRVLIDPAHLPLKTYLLGQVVVIALELSLAVVVLRE